LTARRPVGPRRPARLPLPPHRRRSPHVSPPAALRGGARPARGPRGGPGPADPFPLNRDPPHPPAPRPRREVQLPALGTGFGGLPRRAGRSGAGWPLNPPRPACLGAAHPPPEPSSGTARGGKPSGGRGGMDTHPAPGGVWHQGALGCGGISGRHAGLRGRAGWPGGRCRSPREQARTDFLPSPPPSPPAPARGDAAGGDHNAITRASDRQRIVYPGGKFGSLPRGLGCNVLTLGDNPLRAGAG